MASNKLVIREEEIEELSAGMNRIGNSTHSASKGVTKKFSKTSSAGMGKSVKAVSKELNLISNSINNVKNIMRKHSKEMFDYDFRMAKEAGSIEIPLDFLANNSSKVNTYNRVLLGKIDGRSVNDGIASHEFDEIADNTFTKEDLRNITGEEAYLEKYDDNSGVVRSAVTNIKSDKDQTVQKIDEDTVIGQSVLTNINNGNVQRTQNIDEFTVIGKSVLGKINKDVLPSESKYDDESVLDGNKVNIEKIIPMHEEDRSVDDPVDD